MLTPFRSSFLSSTKRLPIFSHVRALINSLSNLELRNDDNFKQCYYVGQPKRECFTLPRIDYTLDPEVARSNSMITRLCKDGRVIEARGVFDEMPDPDVISWTAMISGYISCGMINEARELFDRGDAKRNVVTWTAMVAGYMRGNQILDAERLFREMPEKNVVSWNSMINGYVKAGRIDEALAFFESMEERNIVSWNMVIGGLTQCGRVDEAWRIFDEMPERNVISWTTMISGLSSNGRVDEARMLFEGMPERNVVSWNAMITGYIKNLRFDEAFELFERMPEKSVLSWNTMISGFIENKDLNSARMLFNEMPRKDVVSWTLMINGSVQNGQSEKAIETFSDMQWDTRVKPNEGTFVCVLSACSNLAGLGEGMQIHQVISKTIYQDNQLVISGLIDMYSKCGELSTARKMFDDGLRGQIDLVSWNGMIAAYAHHGCGREAINLFNDMQKMGFIPNDVTYVVLLAACSHSGLVEEGLNYFIQLMRDESIEVGDHHYSCLIDLCSRAGNLKEAYRFMEQLQTKLPAKIWVALLSGCNVHGDQETGKLAGEKLIEVDQAGAESSSAYMLLSNIYASSGNWKEAAKLQGKMKDRGLRKQPGCSWIEVANRVHVFVAGDRSHDETELLYSLLGSLHMKMKRAVFFTTHNFIFEDDFAYSSISSTSDLYAN
nr:pentatricopeptide repeat-containing protein At2g35030, mitochondrial-like [Ipomoea batatas]GMC86021.1 pentatricopeptide repeat-containing protein At2g35030, mitochondrial-like [Ipomoea batatas]